MKKFLMLSMLICGAMSGAWGAENCNLITGDDATNVRSSKEAFSVNRGVYVCDKDIGADECPYGAVIISGDVVKYCKDQSGYTDTWVSFAEKIGACSQADVEKYFKGTLKRSGKYLLGTNYEEENGVVVCKIKNCSTAHASGNNIRFRVCKITNDEMIACYEAQKQGDPAEWKTDNGGYCTCNDKDGFEPVWNKITKRCNKTGRGDTVKNCLTSGHKAGDTWAVDCKTLGITGGVKCGKRCNSDGSETGYVTQCENNYNLDGLAFTNSKDKYKRCKKIGGQDTEPSVLEKCLASRNTAEGKACCYLPNSVATWDGQKCNCVIEGMEFKIENGAGKCVAKQTQPGETFKCNAAHLALLEGWLVSCKDKPTIVSTINQIKVLCASSGVTAEAFNTLWSALLLLNPGECGTQPDLPPPPHVDDGADRLRVSIRIIRDAHSNLSGMAEGFKVSVWKDDEGKFNTSRLVSDSVAGVVLGTAGGLITSNVVKKNQVENGFEDLKCTIGGQVVADWGDQFRVGIQ